MNHEEEESLFVSLIDILCLLLPNDERPSIRRRLFRWRHDKPALFARCKIETVKTPKGEHQTMCFSSKDTSLIAKSVAQCFRLTKKGFSTQEQVEQAFVAAVQQFLLPPAAAKKQRVPQIEEEKKEKGSRSDALAHLAHTYQEEEQETEEDDKPVVVFPLHPSSSSLHQPTTTRAGALLQRFQKHMPVVLPQHLYRPVLLDFLERGHSFAVGDPLWLRIYPLDDELEHEPPPPRLPFVPGALDEPDAREHRFHACLRPAHPWGDEKTWFWNYSIPLKRGTRRDEEDDDESVIVIPEKVPVEQEGDATHWDLRAILYCQRYRLMHDFLEAAAAAAAAAAPWKQLDHVDLLFIKLTAERLLRFENRERLDFRLLRKRMLSPYPRPPRPPPTPWQRMTEAERDAASQQAASHHLREAEEDQEED